MLERDEAPPREEDAAGAARSSKGVIAGEDAPERRELVHLRVDLQVAAGTRAVAGEEEPRVEVDGRVPVVDEPLESRWKGGRDAMIDVSATPLVVAMHRARTVERVGDQTARVLVATDDLA